MYLQKIATPIRRWQNFCILRSSPLLRSPKARSKSSSDFAIVGKTIGFGTRRNHKRKQLSSASKGRKWPKSVQRSWIGWMKFPQSVQRDRIVRGIIAHQFSTRLHRKAKHRVLSEDRTQALCNWCATGVQRRRF